MKYNNGIDMDELVDDYIELHRDELTRDEFDAYCDCRFGKKELIDDLNDCRDDDEQLSYDASDSEIFDAWKEHFNIWEVFSDRCNRECIADKIQEELDEEFNATLDTFVKRLKKLASKYELVLKWEESRSWNPGIIRSQYFWFEDEDGNIGKLDLIIRFGDAHDNNRNDCDFDLDFRENDKLDEWISDVELNLTSLLNI